MMHRCDVVVIGGGIAGLWCHALLRARGYSSVLLEAESLGQQQTICAQGIIHGGLKYALTGTLGKESIALQDAPAMWQQAFASNGDVSLANSAILAQQQLLLASTVLNKVAGLFAAVTLRGRVSSCALPNEIYDMGFSGMCYALAEIIIDPIQVVADLATQHATTIYRHAVSASSIRQNDDGVMIAIGGNTIHAEHLICSAGTGNQTLSSTPMQRRKLHQIFMRSPQLPRLYFHVLGNGLAPCVTVTSHLDDDGAITWSLGGQLAEEGVQRSPKQQQAAAVKQLQKLFPRLDISGCTWSSCIIDRAEAATSTGNKPTDISIDKQGRIYTVWPTKLALAPKLAHAVVDSLAPSQHRQPALHIEHAKIATPWWKRFDNQIA